MTFLGIKIHTPNGQMGRLEGSVHAIFGAQYLDDLAKKTHAALRPWRRKAVIPAVASMVTAPLPASPESSK